METAWCSLGGVALATRLPVLNFRATCHRAGPGECELSAAMQKATSKSTGRQAASATLPFDCHARRLSSDWSRAGVCWRKLRQCEERCGGVGFERDEIRETRSQQVRYFSRRAVRPSAAIGSGRTGVSLERNDSQTPFTIRGERQAGPNVLVGQVGKVRENLVD